MTGTENVLYDVVGKQLNGIKNMYVNNLACIRVKQGESECFKIDKVLGAIMSLVNARSIKLQCARLLHEVVLMPILLYDIETIIWKVDQAYADGQPLLGIRRVDRVLNTQIKEFCRGMKGLKEVFSDNILGILKEGEWQDY